MRFERKVMTICDVHNRINKLAGPPVPSEQAAMAAPLRQRSRDHCRQGLLDKLPAEPLKAAAMSTVRYTRPMYRAQTAF